MSAPVRIGTRGSALALAQAEMVRAQVAALIPDRGAVLEVFKTSGDRFSIDSPEAPPGPQDIQGLFTKELDEALLAGKIEACIHSLKDVPTTLAPGVALAAVLAREDVRDAVVAANGGSFRDLPNGSRIGTSSPRRTALLRNSRPDVTVAPLRGNLDTRLRKLREGQYDAILVATAGLKRLGRGSEATGYLDPPEFLPSPAQGALGLTARSHDPETLKILSALNDPDTRTCVEAERSFLRSLRGGCSVPVGAYAKREGDRLTLWGVVASLDGSEAVRRSVEGEMSQAVRMGEDLADWCISHGAEDILRTVRKDRS